MSLSTIPQELIHRIIQQLASDKHTLKTASLVSSSFQQWCQELLFTHLTVKVQEHSRASPFQDLIDLLQASPIIGTYFKSIHIEDSSYWGKDALANDARVRLLHDQGFPRAFDLIRTESIQKLSVAKAVITRILQSPSLVHIETTCLPLQAALSLCWGSSVKRLDINIPRGGFDTDASKGELAIMEDTGGDSQRLQLETLAFSGQPQGYFDRFEELVNYLLDGNRSSRAWAVNLKAVKKLKVAREACLGMPFIGSTRSGYPLFDLRPKWINRSLMFSSSAKCIAAQSWTTETQTINFAKCPSLRRLFIRGLRTLEELVAPPDILQIVINNFRGMPAANPRQWSTLDEILSDKVRFPMLRRVKIDLTTGVVAEGLVQRMDEMQRRTEELMPNLKGRGLLELNLLVEEEGVEYGLI
ncbi:hypothetical protein FA15DRAFT_659028 [Coprinopsis marcescibilis]|uniref:F-box domain-containing protein n=1 Tax=Coprinopsis marcescibilis TaxID=230819 RepID=A0A5C3KKS9_COPMA|nr:hypothetical protein FA15DRAFT_659028 [Coprinopsis marcescibilis]